ncbi:MAG: hypothetical protein Q9M32_00650 [Sulfurimonas sp.]|nr:hypothetical protein [Sulfurimonas sp.]MDQ7062152.1 hypothetical protein [Sulfurimonas sp.]
MMKIISLLIFSASYLLSGGFWTLTGVTKANIYVVNQISYLDPQTIILSKQKMNDILLKNGIKTQAQDSPTLMLELQDIEDDETHYIYIKLALGEEVQTFRKNQDKTFALTYQGTDFIDVDRTEIDNEVLESVDFLLSQFIEQFEDDKD